VTTGTSQSERISTLGLILGLGLYLIVPGVSLAGAALSAAAGLAVPRVGLLGALAMLPLHLQTRPIGPLNPSVSELLLAAAAVGTAGRWLTSKRFRTVELRWRRTAFDWPIVLFLSSALLSLLVTEYLRLSLRELRTLILEPVLAYYLLLAWFPNRAVVYPLGAFLCGAMGVALTGLIGMPFGWGTSEAEGVRRLQVGYTSPNHLGLLLGRALPWLVAFAILARAWRGPIVVGVLIVALALSATFSLGSWLGGAAGVVAVVWLVGGKRLAAVAITTTALFGLGLSLLASERISSHLRPGQGTSYFRLQLWQSALAMIRDHPVLGVGLDNFLYLYQQRYILAGALAEANLSHPHNLLLHFWLQLGMLGLAAALWLVARAFSLAQRIYRSSEDVLARAVAIGAVGSLVDFVVHGLIDNSYFLPDLAMIFWLTLAILEALRRGQDTIAPN
jgi:O-antigen ligase